MTPFVLLPIYIQVLPDSYTWEFQGNHRGSCDITIPRVVDGVSHFRAHWIGYPCDIATETDLSLAIFHLRRKTLPQPGWKDICIDCRHNSVPCHTTKTQNARG